LAEGYSVTKDEGYSVSNSYSSIKQTNSNSYSGDQTVAISLPIYQPEKQTIQKRKSKCPRGSVLGEIGSCCGMQCTRTCAMPG